jgi:hypothetical protein
MTLLAVTSSYSRNVPRYEPILAGLCILKVVNPDLYKKAKLGELKFQELKGYLWFDEPLAESDRHVAEAMEKWWRISTDDNVSDELRAEFKQITIRFSAGNMRNLVPNTANNVIDLFSPR